MFTGRGGAKIRELEESSGARIKASANRKRVGRHLHTGNALGLNYNYLLYKLQKIGSRLLMTFLF